MTRVRLTVELTHDDVVHPGDLHHWAIDALMDVAHVSGDLGIVVLEPGTADAPTEHCAVCEDRE